jgi:hypothetical protein
MLTARTAFTSRTTFSAFFSAWTTFTFATRRTSSITRRMIARALFTRRTLLTTLA